MNGNLTQLEKALRKVAKNSKTIKYTKGLLFTFLMTGMMAFSAEVTVKDKEIEQTKVEINDTVKDLKNQFRIARIENEKLLRNANIDLIQLTEQGEQVIKSPWSSWQFGINYYLDDWNSSYKGYGDKQEKYPYEGIYERSTDLSVRGLNPTSKAYAAYMLTNPTFSANSASNAARVSSGYGLVNANTPVTNPVPYDASAAITPKVVSIQPLTLLPRSAVNPTLPVPISFAPITPNITAPSILPLNIPVIAPDGSGNGDDSWIDRTGSTAPIAQQNMQNGTLTVNVNGKSFDTTVSNITMVGEKGTGHNLTNNGVQNFSWTGNTQLAEMKLVGGHEINIDDVTINYTGNGTATAALKGNGSWLFHTDGHDNFGDSTWVLNSGTKINIDGSNLIMYTSQYHSSARPYNIGFVNKGTITTSSSGNNNYIWISLSATGTLNRQMYFDNEGTIELKGKNDTFVLVGTEYAANGGFNITNGGILKLSGDEEKGIIVNNKFEYSGAEILLNNSMEITGNKSTGVAFIGWADLDGGTSFNHSNANNIVVTLPQTSRESILNINLTSNNNSSGLYFEYSGTKLFNINNSALKSTDGTKNTVIYVKNGEVNLASNGKNTINISGGTENIGIYTVSSDNLTTGSKIDILNSDSSIGIYAKSSGTVTNSGDLSVTGKSVKALIADNSVINSTGKIDLTGTSLSSTDGAVGLVAQNNGTLTSTGTSTINIEDSSSIGLFANNGTLSVSNATIGAKNGAFNVYSSNNGTINFDNNNTVNTGQQSLAFLTDSTGKIKFNSSTIANIAGATNANDRGTAFYYVSSTPYGAFDQSAVSTWNTSTFNGTLNNLTLNMATGSRLFIASNVGMNLSNTGVTGLFALGTGPTINGTDYKTFMLYNSKLTIDQNVNLDNSSDAYNMLELANSSVTNNQTITGTLSNQTAIAQEQGVASHQVNILNNGTINLSGSGSTGIYAKGSAAGTPNIENSSTGNINVADNSAAIYGLGNTTITNNGNITMKANSTGIYSSAKDPNTGSWHKVLYG